MTLNIIDLVKLSSYDGETLEHFPKVAAFTLAHPVNLLGKDILAVEVGVFRARSSLFMLDHMPNIKKLVLVDSWVAHDDEFESRPKHHSQDLMDVAKRDSLLRLRSHPLKDKVTILNNTSLEATEYFEDNSIDFIFLDSYTNKKTVEEDLRAWYNKVKIGGLFSGHDYGYPGVHEAVTEFRNEYKVEAPFSTHYDAWCWIKDRNI